MVSKVLHASKSNEHYTPASFLLKVYEFFGGDMDLDPCSARNALTVANVHYQYPCCDGLELPWFGRTFVNPPYGRSLYSWAEKALNESSRAEALFLVPSRTDTKWTRLLSPFARCYLGKRLKFADENGVPQDSAPFPSVLFYCSQKDPKAFTEYWRRYGEVYLPERSIVSVEAKKAKRREYMKEYMRKRRSN